MEDNPGDIGLVREALEEYGVQCKLNIFTDGDQAIEFFGKVDAGTEECPDLIILDLNLPKIPGHEVLKFIRTSAICSQAPLIVLSSSGAQKDRMVAAKLGATRYIEKPAALSDFLKLGEVFRDMLASRH